MTTYPLDPARFRWGTWCHRADKIVGEGDIAASYSADRIGMGQPVRRPFEWKGSLWTCVSKSDKSAEAYRLTHPQAFSGDPLTYRAKVVNGDAARNDPNGFYHGMTVTHGGKDFVLSGPPALLVAGESRQMDLFGGQP
jgi:hypothetical protein